MPRSMTGTVGRYGKCRERCYPANELLFKKINKLKN